MLNALRLVVLSAVVLALGLGLGGVAFAAPATGTPAIFWASDPVRPGEVVVLQGNFPPGTMVWIGAWGNGEAGPPGYGKILEIPLRPVELLQSSPHCLKFLLPPDTPLGLVECDALLPGSHEGGHSVILNAPDPWWMQGDAGLEASPGGWLRIFGKCLRLGDKPLVGLVSRAGRSLTLTPQPSSGWDLSVALPADIVPGKYSVFVHNGCGGQNGWFPAGTMLIAPHKPPWPPTRFSVTDNGAVPDNNRDCTAAVQATIDKASANGGGIVFFPRGKYTLSATLQVPTRVCLQGAGEELVELHWLDRRDPLPALIRGTNSFGVQDLMMTTMNHLAGIVSDTTQPDAGNVVIRRVRMRLDRFLYQKDPQEVERRRLEPLGVGIKVGGANLVITDCDIYVSGQSLNLSRVHGGLVAHNRFSNGLGGWYEIAGSDGLIFEDNRIIGADNYATGGGLDCLDGSAYSQNVFFAGNKLGPFFGWDREAMTTDAGGGAYFGKAVSCAGTTLTLAADARWGGKDWTGAGVFILGGPGAGEYRRIVRTNGREVTVDRPWTVPPTPDSYLSITMLQRHYLLLDNEINDAGIAIQFYGMSIDDVVAGNRTARTGGYHNFGHRYVGGWQPSWYVQYFDNEIVEGNAFGGANSVYPPPMTHLAVYADRLPEFPGPLARCTIMRRNKLDNNAAIEALGGVSDVLIENNTVENSDVGVHIQRGVEGVLLRGNVFHDVLAPLTGGGVETAVMHPAERVAAELRGALAWLPADRRPDWSAPLATLGELDHASPTAAATREGVRAALLEAVRSAAAQRGGAYPLGFLQTLLGLELRAAPAATLLTPARAGLAAAGEVQVAAGLPDWSLPGTLSVAAQAPAGWQVSAGPTVALRPGATAHTALAVTAPVDAWGVVNLPVRYSLHGEGWTLTSADTVTVGNGAVGEWLAVGPFPNTSKELLEPEMYEPEMRLDVSEQYATPGGKVGWKQVAGTGGALDLGRVLGGGEMTVGYALCGLRCRGAQSVSLRVQASQGCRGYLNDAPLVTMEKTGQSNLSVRLPDGDSLLLFQVTHTTAAAGPWRLSVEVTPVGASAPGSVAVIPAAELVKLPRLHLPAVATGAEGSLAEPGNVNWRLVYRDDFERTALGPMWAGIMGNAEIKAGRLAVSAPVMLGYNRPIRAPWRIEYDARSASPGDLSAFWVPAGRSWGDGYYFGFGANGNTVNKLLRLGEFVAQSDKLLITPRRWHHVIVQWLPGAHAQMWVDGTLILDYRDPAPLTDCDTVGLSAWSEAEFDNVRIYTEGPAE